MLWSSGIFSYSVRDFHGRVISALPTDRPRRAEPPNLAQTRDGQSRIVRYPLTFVGHESCRDHGRSLAWVAKSVEPPQKTPDGHRRVHSRTVPAANLTSS